MELEDLLNSSSSDDSGATTLPEPPSTRNTHSRFLSFAPSSSWRSLPPLSRLAPSTHSATSPPPVEDITAIANRWSRRKSFDTPSYITPSHLRHPAAAIEHDQARPRLFPQAVSFPQSGGVWLDDQANSSPVPSSSPSRLFTSSPVKSASSPNSCPAPRSTSHTPASSPRKYAVTMNASSTLSTSASPSKPSTRFMRPGEIDIWSAHETALSSSTSTSGNIFTQPPPDVVASSSLVGGLMRARIFPDDLPPSSPPPGMSSPVRSLPASQDSRVPLPEGGKDHDNSRKADQEGSPSVPQLLPHTAIPHLILVDVSRLPLGSPAPYTITTGHDSFSNDRAPPIENEDVAMPASPHDDQTGSSPPELPEPHEMAVCETSPLKRKASQVSPTSTPTQPILAMKEASGVFGHEVAAQPLVIDQDIMPTLPEGSVQPPALKRQKTQKTEPLTPNPRRITPAAQRLQNKKLATPFRSPLHPQAHVALSGPARSAAQISSPSAKASSSARKFDSSPLRPSSSSLVSAGSSTPSRATAPVAKKDRSSRVTSQFKSPFKRSASGTSTAPTPALSSSRLTPAVQALEAKVQLLRRAVKIKEAESGGTQKPLDELVLKWRTAGRDIARDVWSVVKDGPKQDAGGWPAERGSGFNSSWGYDKDDAEGADAQTDGARERFQEHEMAKEKVEDDIGTMLRQLRIDPATLGWDDEEGDFVEV